MTVLNASVVFSSKQDDGHCCCVKVSTHKVCVYWKTLLKLFPLDSSTTYCILLLGQVWNLSINVPVFPEVTKLLKPCIFD
jgi:hypothetical protein